MSDLVRPGQSKFTALIWPAAVLSMYTALRRQTAVTAYFLSEQLLLFAFARRVIGVEPDHTL